MVTAVSELVDDPVMAARQLCSSIHSQDSLRKYNLGILFAHIHCDHEKLLSELEDTLGLPVIGCTTYTEANSHGYFEESLSLSVLSSNLPFFNIAWQADVISDAAFAGLDIARSLLDCDEEPRLVLAFPDTALAGHTELFLKNMHDALPEDCTVAGGLPGDYGQMNKPLVFYNRRAHTGGAVAVSFFGDVNPRVVTRNGWTPIGTQAVVTRADRNRLIELDGRPAVEYLRKYSPDIDDPELLALHPLVVSEKSGGHDVIRSAFFYDHSDGSILLGGDISEGQTVRLAQGGRKKILDSAGKAVAEFNLNNGDYSALFFFSCAGRKMVLGLDTKLEIETVRHKTSLPVNGFYCYGEIGAWDSDSTDNRSHFHNCTLVLVAL